MTTQTQLTQLEQAQHELTRFLSGRKMEKIAAAAGHNFDSQQYVRLLLQSCRDEKSTLKLLACDHNSIYTGALAALDYGIVIGGPASEASLVPFGGKAVLVVEYRGWKRMARRSTDVDDIEMESVHVGDQFKFINSRTEPEHTYSESKTRRTDPVTGAYAIVYLSNGRIKCRYWTVEECINHRDTYSKNWERGKKDETNPWHEKNAAFGLMCAKSVFLHMCRRGDCPIELTERFQEATDSQQQEPSEPMEGTVLKSEVIDSTVVEPEPETVAEKPEAVNTKDDGPSFKFTGVMCQNLSAALQNVRSLAKVGVIREYCLKQAENPDETEYILDTCKVREADIREARSKKAAKR